ncbi:SAD1/UNC-84 domain protein 1-like protein [Tanacetum coccineum]
MSASTVINRDGSHSIKDGTETVSERSTTTTRLRKKRMLRNLGFFYGGGVGFEIERVYYESHIAEIEAFLKTTNKMMQTQVDVVDRKLDIEVSRLQSELGKRMDDFNKRFNEIDAEIGRDERGEIGLDEIRAFVKGVVEKEIGRLASDRLARVDYAVASGGASVVKYSKAYVGVSWVSRVSEWLKGGSVRGDSVKLLQPSFGQPGECFPLKEESGFVEIKLRTMIVPEAITLEHVDKVKFKVF